MAYTQQQITDEVNRILSSGGSWSDVLAEAQQYGVPQYMLPINPATLTQLQQGSTATTSGYTPYQGTTADGYAYQPDVSMGTGENNLGNNTFLGYAATDPNHTQVGDPVYNYSPAGNYTNTTQIMKGDPTSDLLIALAGMGGLSLLGPALSGAMAGSTAASTLGTNGAFLGENVASGVPAWDAAATNAGLSLTGGAAPFTFNGAVDSQAANEALGLGPVTDPVNPAQYLSPTDPSIFNAAKDSQLANEQLGLGPVTDMTPPAYPAGSMPSVPSVPGGVPKVPTTIPGGSIADWTKLLTGLTTLFGAASKAGTPAPAPATPFDYGPARYMPPGWRTDRPMYVPGQDEIPEGWLGAGGTTNG